MFDKIRKNTWPCFSGEYHSLTNFKIFIPLLVFVCVVGLSFNDSVYAQSSSSLDLNYISSTAYSGDKITFSGYLTTTSGNPVSGATIKIKDDVRFRGDPTIKTLTTNYNGYFSGTWTAQVRDSGKWDFYAEFDGSSSAKKSRSDTYNVKVYSSSRSSSSSSSSSDDSYSNPSYSKTYTSILVLNHIPSTAISDDKITFSGRLTTTSGHVLPNAKIWIMDDVRLGSDTAIKTLYTDSSGYFSGTWTAQVRDSGKWDFYAQYYGSSNVEKDRSTTYNVKVSSPPISAPSNSKQSTSITFYKIPSSIYAGDTITFTGKLETNGKSLRNAFIQIYDDDPGYDDKLSSGYTDSNGRFTIIWQASQGLVEKELEIYAVFDGNSNYKRDRSSNQEINILQRGASITLDPLPASARLGERITFSGTLNIDLQNPKNSVVYIKDEDTAGRDDLLATAYVNSNGWFSTTWFVTEVDFLGRDAEIFAVYEGNKFTDRTTTAITKLSILDALPRSSNVSSYDKYMNLYYSLPFDKDPLVAIIPAPASFDEVRSHINPVKEGIKMSTLQLEQKYGGYWNVDFDVVYPGSKFKSKPDIIMNLVTTDQDSGCIDKWGGWASVSGIKPLQSNVCSSNSQGKLPNDFVSATAAHEFIHAMGLGHTFNVNYDLMCSIENGKYTCNKIHPANKKFSNFNLEAIAKLYGSDGFLNPNNYVKRGTHFPINNFDNWDDSNSMIKTTPTTIKPTSTSCTTSIADYDYQINDLILKSNYHMPYTICDPGDISFRFSSSYSTDGFIVYVLPPETNVADFVYRADGKYYTCEEYKKTWHKKGNTCNVRVGSHIVLHNPEDHAITINGWIRN